MNQSVRRREANLFGAEIRRAASLALGACQKVSGLSIGRSTHRHGLVRVLSSLRRGTAHLLIRLPHDRQTILVGRSADEECSWFTNLVEHELPGGRWTTRIEGLAAGWPVVLSDCMVLHDHSSSDGENWTLGRASELHLGQPDQHEVWELAVDGLPHQFSNVALNGHQLSVTPNAERSLTLITLQASTAIDLAVATDSLMDFVWLARLAQLSSIYPVARWSHDRTEGAIAFDALDKTLPHPLVRLEHGQEFLRSASLAWSTWSASEQLIGRIAIDILLSSVNSNLETGIALSSAGLELISMEWGPPGKVDHPIDKPTRRLIAQDLVASAARHAPGTDFAANAATIAGWLFSRPAKDRFNATAADLGMTGIESGVAHFVNTRNKVIHGGFQLVPREDRIRAAYFGRTLLAHCIARKLGYAGPLRDWNRLVPQGL